MWNKKIIVVVYCFRLSDFMNYFLTILLVKAKHVDIPRLRKERAPCGVPYHALDNYLAKLMDQNFSCM